MLIDGNNLLHRERSGVDEGAVRGLLARLQRALPAGARATVVLDGHPAPGSPGQARVSATLNVRHAGGQSADDALLAMIAGLPFAARAGAVVVTDDRSLTERVRMAGGHTRRLEWLQALLVAPAAVAGSRRAPGLGAGRPTDDPDSTDERPAWRPGRGATRKKGNPHRGHPRA